MATVVDYVEMSDANSEANEISKSSLYHIHQSQMCNDPSNVNNTNQLVLALGGIDKILSPYLSPENNINLS